MRITDSRRRQAGGAAAVAAAFWLGFLCGGGGSLSGTAAIQEPSAERQQDPPPASQPPEEPSPVAEESSEADPAADAPSGPEANPATDAAGPEADPATDAAGPEPPLVQDRPREFTADTGVMLNFVTPGGESAFEETMTRVAEALAMSESEERRRQAAGWSTYRAEEPLAEGVLLYISWFDPAVPGADYWIPDILNEAFPTEVQALYETYVGAFADGQVLLNLTPVAGP